MSEPIFQGAVPERDGAVFNVKAYGAAGDGRADDTRAIRRAAEALSAARGGTLLFPAGTYRIFGTAEFQDLAVFQHLDGVRLEGTGATLVIDRSRGTELGRVFNFAFCRNVTVDGFKVRGPVSTFRGGQVTGFAFCNINAGCSGFSFPRNEVQGCMLGIAVLRNMDDPSQRPSRGIQVGVLTVRDCWYGINCQNSGDDMTVSLLETDHVFRSYYVYGVHNHRVSVRSRNVQADDILLWSWGAGCEDIHVKYVNRGNGATDNPVFARDASFNAETNNKITIGWSGPTPGTHRNIHLDVNVDYTGGGRHAGASLLHIDKRREGGAPAVEDIGHVLENLTLTGTVRGTPSAGGGLIYTAPAARWGERVAPGRRRDRWTNFVFQNLRIESRAPVNMALDALDRLTLINVQSDAPFSLRDRDGMQTSRAARIEAVNSSIPNLHAPTSLAPDEGGAEAFPLVSKTVAEARAAIPPAWSGSTVDNRLLAGPAEWSLPPAVPGREFTFVSVVPHELVLAPAPGERISGSFADLRLRLLSWSYVPRPGAVVTLKCIVPGAWEILGIRGDHDFV